ncbi:unnamed protein product [Parajaminaea phylloscopi]
MTPSDVDPFVVFALLSRVEQRRHQDGGHRDPFAGSRIRPGAAPIPTPPPTVITSFVLVTTHSTPSRRISTSKRRPPSSIRRSGAS